MSNGGREPAGEAWPFDEPGAAAPDETARMFARVFGGADGRKVLAHLRGMTVEAALPPTATDAMLRHVEGQRCLVRHIETLVKRGETDGE